MLNVEKNNMDEILKKQYKELVDYYFNTVKIEKNEKKDNLSVLEKKWMSLVDCIYVIGTNETINNFIEIEGEPQSIKNLISRVTIPNNNFLKDFFSENKRLENLYNWFLECHPNQIKTLGCHLSHALISKDVVINKIGRAHV